MQRDGFVIYELSTGEEVHFIACDKNGRMRERAELGLLHKVDPERFYFGDTRDQLVPENDSKAA